MPFSYAQYAGNGSTTTFSVPFPYILKAHVKAYIGYSLVDGTFETEILDGPGFTWTSGTQIQTAVAPAAGKTLTIIRSTPGASLVVQWQDGSNLIAEDLIDSDLQNLYVVQEQRDRNDAGLVAAAASAAQAAAQALLAAASSQAAIDEAEDAKASADDAIAAANAVTSTANAAAAAANQAVAIATQAATPLSQMQILEPLEILSSGSFSIGRPGRIPFGIGPAPVAGVGISGISQRDYYPVHHASGSFI